MQDSRNLPDPNADLFVSPIDFRELNQHKTLANGVKVLTRTVYSTEARRRFATLLDRFSPDLIHLQNFGRHITSSILFEARQRGLPAVRTLHDYGLACPNSHFLIDRTGQICEACRGGRFYQAMFKRCKKGSLLASGMAAFGAYCNRWMGAVKKVDALLTPSRFLKSKLLENGFDETQIHHLPLFLPLLPFVWLKPSIFDRITRAYASVLDVILLLVRGTTHSEMMKMNPHCNPLTQSRLHDILERAGFDVVAMTATNLYDFKRIRRSLFSRQPIAFRNIYGVARRRNVT